MHLESEIFIDREPGEVWRFLGAVENVAKWDRGVLRTTSTKTAPGGVGTEFSTFARADSDWGKMSYRIVESGPDYCKLQLMSRAGNARFFRDAYWTFRTEPHSAGTRVRCSVDFSVRFLYIFLAPLIYGKRSAIFTDLQYLKRAIENERSTEPNR